MNIEDIINLIYIIPAVLIAIIIHEMAHGFVSYKLGDPTPKNSGRLSFNPKNHLDPIGTICLILFQFGWAKPVMVNPNYYRNRKLGMALVALAGPIINFIVAFIAFCIFGIFMKFNFSGTFIYHIITFIHYLILINLGLGIFNLIPLPPLDGSKILGALLPDEYYFKFMKFEKYGMILLFILLSLGVFDKFLLIFQSSLYNGMKNIIIWMFNI